MQSIDANILDFTLKATGATDALFDLAMLNGVGITEDVALGTPVLIPTTTYEVKPVEVVAPVPEFEAFVIKQRQTVPDFTCQYCGTMEALFVLAELNGVGITEAVAPGTELKAVETLQKVAAFYRGGVRDIVTEPVELVKPGGIGYMQISTDFIVS